MPVLTSRYRRAAAAVLVGFILAAVVTIVAPARPSVAHADFLLSPQSAARLVPDDLQRILSRLQPQAATAVAKRRTVLGKALALERLVHTAVLPTGATCAGYATVMDALARELGLPARLTFGGTGISAYDTHTTVAVWLPRYKRWAIVDPTFGGVFVRGTDSRPLGAIDLRDALLQGWWPQIHWRSSARDSTPPSGYYFDPRFVFRYVGVYADIAGSVAPLTLPDSTILIDADYAAPPEAFARTPANRPLTARVPSAFIKKRTSTNAFVLPPAYAPREIWYGRVSLPTTLSVPSGSVAVWVSEPGVDVAGYGSALVRGGSLSPVFPSTGKIRIAGQGQVTVHVYRARTFPAWLES